MDIFKFRNPTAPTRMEQGEIVDNLKSKMWIERYREAGDFTITADIDSGAREKLPLGTFISHVDTEEIMMVENHEISEDRGKPTDVKITGRGFDAVTLEQRIVSSNRVFPNVFGSADFELGGNYSWVQAKYLIENHILLALLQDPSDELPYVEVDIDVEDTAAVLIARSVPRGQTVYSSLLSILEIDNLGIKVARPASGETNTKLILHSGVNRSAQVVYSYDTGEIESSDYLWSIKRLKTSALVSGKWIEIRVDDPTKSGIDRRMMYVDASDIDDAFTAPPEGSDLVDIQVKMEQRGLAALAAQKEIALVKAEVSKENTKVVYRRDFNVGDLIMVSGDYNETRPMRISEFVEIEDENGQQAYPTLTIDEVEG